MNLFVCFMVFNATFINISVISWQSVLLVEETGGLIFLVSINSHPDNIYLFDLHFTFSGIWSKGGKKYSKSSKNMG